MSCECEYQNYGRGFEGRSCCCSFPTLVILILIVLQFSKHHHEEYDDDYEDDHDDEKCEKHPKSIIDNGILFIIALFYLSCCGAGCGRGFGQY